MAFSLDSVSSLDINQIFSGNAGGFAGQAGSILTGVLRGLWYALIVAIVFVFLWFLLLRPLLYNIEVERNLVEGRQRVESTVRGRIFRGRDGVVRFQIYLGLMKKPKNLPEPPFAFFSTKQMPNGKTKRKIRYLVSSEDVWIPIPPPEFKGLDGNDISSVINIPEADVDLWNIQEKKTIERALTKETWWERNKNFIQYLAAWAFTLIIVYIVVDKLGSTLTEAQTAIDICQNVQTQCKIAGANLAGG